LITLYAQFNCPDIPETVLVIVRMKQMVVATITKIARGGPGWRTFAEIVFVIVRRREDGIGLVSITRIESGKMHQVGFCLIVF